MTRKNATLSVNYQQRAKLFAVNDIVYPFWGSAEKTGRVVAVYPAIGMVDVEWPHGNDRVPVEDLQQLNPHSLFQPPSIPAGEDSIPGGAGQVSVSPGPVNKNSALRVAAAFIKKALYWADKDRQYKATQGELDDKCYHCPKCGEELRKAIYKRRDGASVHLLGCGTCLFLIKKEDIIGDPEYAGPNIEIEGV
jgi:hypothetical protein